MSVIIKHSSAFSPVEQGTQNSSFSHPFSIKNLLNLDESCSNVKREMVRTPNLPSTRSTVIMPPFSQSFPLRVERTTSICYDEADTRIPPWIYANRYCRQGILSGNFINVRRPRKPLKKHKQRPLFSQKQIQRLEEEFSNEKYISKSRRSTLAAEISLTDAQVRTWFQNRRTRWRKEVHGEDEICLSDVRNPWQIPKCNDGMSSSYTRNCLIVRGYCCS